MQISKLDGMEARYMALEDQLSDPSVIADQNRWRELSKEHAELGEIVFKYREYKEALKGIQDALELLDDKSQADLHELAKEELKENEEKRDALDLEIHKMLIPKDPNDGKNVILEIRAGTGGEEPHRLEVALLDRSRPRRTFRRLDALTTSADAGSGPGHAPATSNPATQHPGHGTASALFRYGFHFPVN